jgi:N-acetylglucosaminyl-diphospho-decaprenol L-rhamnosyltransferase
MEAGTTANSELVDVVIPTYDARDLTLECLDRLDDGAIAKRIVVDDVSSDGTPTAVRERFDDVTVVELDEHRGLSHALNAGAAAGNAPYILFMNNDLLANPGAVSRLVEALAADPDAVSAGPRLLDADGHGTQDPYRPRDFPTLATILVRLLGIERLWRGNPWSGGHLRSRLADDEVTRVDQQPAGACLLVERRAFERIGGWDEGYWFWYEDVDLSRRLADIGPALWVGDATLVHEGMHSTSSWPKYEQRRRLYLGTLRYSQQHLGGWRAFLVALVMLITSALRTAGGTIARRPSAEVDRALVGAAAAALAGQETVPRIPPEHARRRDGSTPQPEPPHPSPFPSWALALVFTVAYTALIAVDLYVASIPVRLFLVAGTLIAWWMARDDRWTLERYRFAMPVIALGVAVPVIWTLVAAFYAGVADTAANHTFTWTLQNASRFTYVLLYFPLVDFARRFGDRTRWIWLIPAYAMCALTAAIWLDHLITGREFDVQRFLFLTGAIGGSPAGFRVFLGNQILLIPAFGLLLASVAVKGWSRGPLIGLAVIMATAFLAHTRGIWLGLSVLCAAVLLVMVLRSIRPNLRLPLALAAASCTLLLVAAGALMLAGAIPRPGFFGDASTGVRVDQAGPLWEGFRAHPVLGSGLGSALGSGFARDPDSPWSFELTFLQILFQLGAVGLILVLWLPLAVIWRTAGEVLTSPRIRVGALASLIGLLGIMLASATNPYLLTNFGMLSVAMAVSLAEPAREPEALRSPALPLTAVGSGSA